MTNQQHPVIPDPELLQEWYDDKTDYFTDMIRAAQWGADQELEACCEWHRNRGYSRFITLREDRRPKPPSLKEQALAALLHLDHGQHNERCLIIRRALEQLND
jgi:hypothetical protein